MSNDPMLTTMLEEHERTADNLVRGVNVSNETMQRYHGVNGKLLVQAIKNLWSQQELDVQIDARVAARCATCKRKEEKGVEWRAIVRENASGIVWGIVVILAVACVTGNADQIGDGVGKAVAIFARK